MELTKIPDNAGSAEVQRALRTIGEFYDCVLIMATRHDDEHGTVYNFGTRGNAFTQKGLVVEFLDQLDSPCVDDDE